MGPPMVRMWVDGATFRPAPAMAVRLVPADIGDLNKLYDFGLTSWLPSESVANGVYYGIRINGHLVAAAGTHVVSRTDGPRGGRATCSPIATTAAGATPRS